MRLYLIIFLFILSFISFCHQEKNNDSDSIFLILGLFNLAYQNATSIACTNTQLEKKQANRIYRTGFESSSEFSSFYIVPQNYQSASSHDISSDNVYSGNSSHKAWIYTRGPECSFPTNCNHRGYPTIQLHKLPEGGFKTPVYIEFYSYLDMSFPSNSDWFSFATFAADSSDQWKRVVLINIDAKNKASLMHVPLHNQNTLTFQDETLTFPQKTWVKLSVCLDFDPNKGFAKVWQNDILLSTAEVKGTCGVLEQAHFGLYASPTSTQGLIYNDDLLIKEVTSCP